MTINEDTSTELKGEAIKQGMLTLRDNRIRQIPEGNITIEKVTAATHEK